MEHHIITIIVIILILINRTFTSFVFHFNQYILKIILININVKLIIKYMSGGV